MFPDGEELLGGLSFYGDMIYYHRLQQLAQTYTKIAIGYFMESDRDNAGRNLQQADKIQKFIMALITEAN